MVSGEGLREAVARALCEASGVSWASITGGAKWGWREKADAALRTIVEVAGVEAGDLTNAAWAVGQYRGTNATTALLRALASAAQPPEAADG